MSEWQAVFFDFDGVVLDSVQIKTRAFAEMYRPFGKEVEDAVVAYHLSHGGVSRFEKFKHFHSQFLQLPLTETDLQAMGRTFEDLVLRRVMEAPYIPGARECLEMLKVTGTPTFVISGTPETEVRHIVEARGLSTYFMEVHGSPRKKGEILQDLLDRCCFEPELTLFLGDAMTDYHAALQHGVKFLGIVPPGEDSAFPDGTRTAPEVTIQCFA